MNSWFEVDKDGLAKLIEARGRGFAVLELIQNAWDQNVTRVDVRLRQGDVRGHYLIDVEDDDPEGFADLAHAFTLFADTGKRKNPEQRGRFNLGEKLVLALCTDAAVSSTTGTVLFRADGTREKLRRKREGGSLFSADIRMTKEDYVETVAAINTLIPPRDSGIVTTFNGERLTAPTLVQSISLALPIPLAEGDNVVRIRQRTARVDIYRPRAGETPTLYELGIPIVETGDKWHIDVRQKVPLNPDRDNVPPSYLRTVRTAVLNALHDRLDAADANAGWVREGASDPRCAPEAITRVLDLRFGERRVAYDPNDMEANKRAVAAGYTVVTGGSLSGGEWSNAKAAAAIPPAGQVTPSPKPYAPDGADLTVVPESDWTPDMAETVGYAKRLAWGLIQKDIRVTIANQPGWGVSATYGHGHLVLNLDALGRGWFRAQGTDEQHALLLHELAHDRESDHLSDRFHDTLCMLGARLARLALEREEPFATWEAP